MAKLNSNRSRATLSAARVFDRETMCGWNLLRADDADFGAVFWYRDADLGDFGGSGDNYRRGGGDANEASNDYCYIGGGGICYYAGADITDSKYQFWYILLATDYRHRSDRLGIPVPYY